MKVFTSEGIEKQENADVLVELEGIQTGLRSITNEQQEATREHKIANLHLGILNDQHIEEPP
ncbi:hypothetical protein LCGC14_2445970 [marine sediment metagenome]|uniref:Uncharacterized protein n=1 Tax=marine sediment metagenome TaxID=412755 RepID=A0A0F9BHT7_9ZZZZ